MTDEELKEFREFQEWKKRCAEAEENSQKKAEETDNKDSVEVTSTERCAEVEESSQKKTEEIESKDSVEVTSTRTSPETEKPKPVSAGTQKQTYGTSPDNNGCIVALLVLVIGAIILIILGKGMSSDNSSNDAFSQDSMMVDSAYNETQAAEAEAYRRERDSIDAAEKAENEKIAARLKPKMRFNKDEFEKNKAWVYPKTATKYVNTNDIYCYFCIVNGVAQNFRLVIQYYAEDWLFIRSYKFNVDDALFDYTPDEIKRDNNSRIWEWSDQRVQPIDNSLIIALTMANSAKIKFIGRDYSKSRSITRKQLDAIRDVYDYYKALGGKL